MLFLPSSKTAAAIGAPAGEATGATDLTTVAPVLGSLSTCTATVPRTVIKETEQNLNLDDKIKREYNSKGYISGKY